MEVRGLLWTLVARTPSPPEFDLIIELTWKKIAREQASPYVSLNTIEGLRRPYCEPRSSFVMLEATMPK